MSSSIAIRLAERGVLPDCLIRFGIRQLAKERLASLPPHNGNDLEAYIGRFVAEMAQSPIAVLTDKANAQHYEVPAEFFQLVLGAQRKYSCCLYPQSPCSLNEAEEFALSETAAHAQLADGQTILELGCGWGSLSLWMARQYPNSHILGVSNSQSQRASILDRAQREGLSNLEIQTADMNGFETERRFDRVVSVEMFEHMRNWQQLMNRISNWLKPEGRFFMHVFTQKDAPYLFEVADANDWMSEYFFSGGMMPSLDLPGRIESDLEIEAQWRWSGEHYQKTSDHWLANMDRNRDQIMPILRQTYGDQAASLWWHRWRLFFLACAEIFGYQGGSQWPVGHYRFKRANAAPHEATLGSPS